MADPNTVTGLYGWWKADAITGVANGATITNWPDSGPNGFTMTQGSSGNRATYITGAVNGLPIARFAGNQFFTSSASASLATCTIFAVIMPGGSGDRTMIGPSDNGGRQYKIATGTPYQTFMLPGVAVQGTSTPSQVSTSVYSVVAVAYTDPVAGSGGALAFWLNGSVAGSTFTPTTSRTTGRSAWIGVRGGGEFYAGDIAEIIVYNVVLSAGDRGIVHSYVQDKYAITVSDYVSSAAPWWPKRRGPSYRR